MTAPSDSPLGKLRVEVSAIQQGINQYLTERMKAAAPSGEVSKTEDDLEELDEEMDEEAE